VKHYLLNERIVREVNSERTGSMDNEILQMLFKRFAGFFILLQKMGNYIEILNGVM
jgi:hypothetical protein